VYPKIRTYYSSKLSSLIDMMLQVNPEDRPQASEIVRFVERLGKATPTSERAALDEESTLKEKTSLLKTIEIPADLNQIEAVLPRPNYLSASSMGFNNHISKSLNTAPKSALPSIKSTLRLTQSITRRTARSTRSPKPATNGKTGATSGRRK